MLKTKAEGQSGSVSLMDCLLVAGIERLSLEAANVKTDDYPKLIFSLKQQRISDAAESVFLFLHICTLLSGFNFPALICSFWAILSDYGERLDLHREPRSIRHNFPGS